MPDGNTFTTPVLAPDDLKVRATAFDRFEFAEYREVPGVLVARRKISLPSALYLLRIAPRPPGEHNLPVTIHAPQSRRLVPGTTGWTEDDLYDPNIERIWEQGRFEIVEGVLTKMPPAYVEGSLPLRRLVRQVENHLTLQSIAGEFGFELDIVINRIRVPRVDAVFVTLEQLQRQAEAQSRLSTRSKLRYGRLRVALELVIESVSPGHELHDRQTKRQWYAGFGIPNYWILDAYQKTLDCLRLEGNDYQVDATGAGLDEIAVTMFPGLKVLLGKIWI